MGWDGVRWEVLGGHHFAHYPCMVHLSGIYPQNCWNVRVDMPCQKITRLQYSTVMFHSYGTKLHGITNGTCNNELSQVFAILCFLPCKTKVAKKPYCSLCSVTLSMSTSRQGIERWGFSEGANKICRVRGALVLTLVTLAAASICVNGTGTTPCDGAPHLTQQWQMLEGGSCRSQAFGAAKENSLKLAWLAPREACHRIPKTCVTNPYIHTTVKGLPCNWKLLITLLNCHAWPRYFSFDRC